MLLICAVQAVSMSGLPIFRHRARRGNLMTTCAFLSRASHAHASLAQQRCRSPDSVPWSSPWAPPRRWTSRWTTSSRRRVRVRRVSVPRIVVVASSRGPVLSRRAFRSDRILTSASLLVYPSPRYRGRRSREPRRRRHWCVHVASPASASRDSIASRDAFVLALGRIQFIHSIRPENELFLSLIHI